MHQRSCRVVSGLNNELRVDLEAETINRQSTNTVNNNTGTSHNDFIEEVFPNLKQGINLPKTDDEWSTANDYFKVQSQLMI